MAAVDPAEAEAARRLQPLLDAALEALALELGCDLVELGAGVQAVLRGLAGEGLRLGELLASERATVKIRIRSGSRASAPPESGPNPDRRPSTSGVQPRTDAPWDNEVTPAARPRRKP